MPKLFTIRIASEPRGCDVSETKRRFKKAEMRVGKLRYSCFPEFCDIFFMATFDPKLVPVEPAWYCVRVRPKQEAVSARMLRSEAGIEVFCPFIRFKRARRGGTMWVTEGMFPGYLFGRFAFAEHHRHIVSISGVSTIVRFGEQPAVVPDQIIAELKAHVTGDETIVIEQSIEPGTEVRIVEGAYAGVTAVVSRLLPARERVAVLLEVLGMEREVEISAGAILPDASHPLSPE
jgi:transcriptional antiterminator RfaH